MAAEPGDIMVSRLCVVGEKGYASAGNASVAEAPMRSAGDKKGWVVGGLADDRVRWCASPEGLVQRWPPGVMRCELMMGVRSPSPGDHGSSSSIWPPSGGCDRSRDVNRSKAMKPCTGKGGSAVRLTW